MFVVFMMILMSYSGGVECVNAVFMMILMSYNCGVVC